MWSLSDMPPRTQFCCCNRISSNSLQAQQCNGSCGRSTRRAWPGGWSGESSNANDENPWNYQEDLELWDGLCLCELVDTMSQCVFFSIRSSWHAEGFRIVELRWETYCSWFPSKHVNELQDAAGLLAEPNPNHKWTFGTSKWSLANTINISSSQHTTCSSRYITLQHLVCG